MTANDEIMINGNDKARLEAARDEETADERRDRIDRLTHSIIGAAQSVSNTLGCGFLEKVYENALAYEMRKAGLEVKQQHPIEVYYDGQVVGAYTADLLVEDCVLVELKAVTDINSFHHAQCINYLKATGLNVCLLINFGNPKVEVRRKVHNF